MSRGGHRLYAIKSDLAFLPIVVALPREKKHKSAIQGCAALAFQEFHDFLRLVSLDAHFLERRARVLEKSIEVSVVQSLLPRLCMGGGNIFACIYIYDASAEEHGDEHTLPCKQVPHIGGLKEVADTFIGQDSSVEGIRDRKSTRLNSSHANISYAVFCLKKKK